MWPFRRRSDRDFATEIETHVVLETDRLIADGFSPDEARQAARRRFGNITAARERFYESHRILWLDELVQDVRYSLRALRRSPGFAAVAVTTLALGIGASTAIFNVVNALLLRPLPYADPDSLFLVESSPIVSSPPWVVSAWRERSRSVRAMAGFRQPQAGTLVTKTDPEQIVSAEVTWNLFSFLGIAPAAGRELTEADALPNAPPVAVLSHDFWRRRFGGDPGIVGTTIAVNGDPVTIAGISGQRFLFPVGRTFYGGGLPVPTQPDIVRVAAARSSFNVIARLAPSATPSSAARDLLAIFREEGRSRFSPSLLERLELGVVPLQERLVGDLRQRLLLVMGAVGFVLLVACANVANLLVARASTRQRELAVRHALGARRWRLARLLLTESVLLALIGAVGAILIAWATTGVARTLVSYRIPFTDTIAIDWRVLSFSVTVAALTGIVCGFTSLSAISRLDLAATFHAGIATTVTGRTAIRRALLSVEVAVTFVLVVGAALLGQTFWNLNAKERGFDAARLLTMRVSPGLRVEGGEGIRAGQTAVATLFSDLTQRMTRLPGVAAAAAVSSVPLTGLGMGMGLAVEGQPVLEPDASSASVAAVTPDYFRTMGIDVESGRAFTDRDRAGTPAVAVVNEAFRRRFAANRDVVGLRVTSDDRSFTIVGLVEDVPDASLREAATPLLFMPLQQTAGLPFFWPQLTLVVRTNARDPHTSFPDVRRQIWAVDPNIVIEQVATMDERVAAAVRSERQSAALLGLLAIVALGIAAIGVYGVAAYAMAQRTKEIGIRIALGAARSDVAGLVISQALWPTLLGIAAGLAGAAGATRVVASMLYGVTALDPATFAGAALVLLAAALAATYVPARRATGIDPLISLRYE